MRPPKPQWEALGEWVATVTNTMEALIATADWGGDNKLSFAKTLRERAAEVQEAIESEWCERP